MRDKFIDLSKLQPVKIDKDFNGWLESNSLARFVVDIVDQLDTSTIESKYTTHGSEAYPPKMMLSLLFYCYASGIFSSRKIRKATYEVIPTIFIAQGLHPDHSSIANFRKRFLGEINDLFVQILMIAAEMGALRLGDVSLDGTKIKANASKHKALSYEYACKLEKQLQDEVDTLMSKSDEPDSTEIKDLDIPAEIKRRKDRLKKIDKAKRTIEARRSERYEQEKAVYDAKVAEREAKEKARGRKLGGKKPVEPTTKPKPSDQVNLTDEDSRIMPTSGGGFEQAFNAQAAVDIKSMLIVENHVSQNTNDKRELSPALDNLEKLPEELGSVKRLAADHGYKSESNISLSDEKNIELYVPAGRQKHNAILDDLLSKEQPNQPENPDLNEALVYRMGIKSGKAFYALRKSTIEPTFGIIKERMGFRRFLLRGLDLVSGEWTLVCIAYNLKRLCALNLKLA